MTKRIKVKYLSHDTGVANFRRDHGDAFEAWVKRRRNLVFAVPDGEPQPRIRFDQALVM